MSKYEIELVLKNGPTVIGEAIDEGAALNVMDEAMRQYPTGHIRVRRARSSLRECRLGHHDDQPSLPTVLARRQDARRLRHP
jgi:hypothetical protein